MPRRPSSNQQLGSRTSTPLTQANLSGCKQQFSQQSRPHQTSLSPSNAIASLSVVQVRLWEESQHVSALLTDSNLPAEGQGTRCDRNPRWPAAAHCLPTVHRPRSPHIGFFLRSSPRHYHCPKHPILRLLCLRMFKETSLSISHLIKTPV